jgi:hypothetical protein
MIRSCRSLQPWVNPSPAHDQEATRVKPITKVSSSLVYFLAIISAGVCVALLISILLI